MANENVKARIQLKNDTEANWEKAKNFRPLKGEIIIYSTDESHPFSRLKVGDGINTVSDLPFAINSDTEGVIFNTTKFWETYGDIVPRKNVFVVYTDTKISGKIAPRIKLGDGKFPVSILPFLDDFMIEHISNTDIHITAEERTKWNNKINGGDIVSSEVLILNNN